MTKEDIMNMSINDCIELLKQKDSEIEKLKRKVETLGKKCNRYEEKLTTIHFGGKENIPKKNKQPSKTIHRQFAGFKGYGYYSFVENDEFVIGEERGREGGELYRGDYLGCNTPYLNNIKIENPKMYNSIVKYFG